MYSYKVGTDMIFAAAALASLYFLLRENRCRWMNLVLAGLLAGLAYLIRYNGIFLAAAAPFLIWRNPWRLGGWRRWGTGGAFIAFFLATITPWGFHCLREKGQFFYSLNYRNIALEVYEGGNWTAPD